MSNKTALERECAPPLMDLPMLNKLKRKHSLEVASPPPVTSNNKKQRPRDSASQLPPPTTTQARAKTEAQQTFTRLPTTHVAATSPAIENTSMRSAHPRSPLVHSYNANPESPASAQHNSVATMEDVSMEDVSMSDATSSSSSAGVTDLSSLQQVIESEFNMQILMKHNELRLIEQELAKCQIALEQLRRCELRPFPGNEGPAESVSTGTGPSIAPPGSFPRPPPHPAPYGVADGPYSRHYRQWLLQDPLFIATPIHSPLDTDSPALSAARSTRNTASSRKSVNKSFPFSRRPRDPVSLPNYPVAPKDKSSPLVLRRSTDGQMVKLICNNCLRGNFSSIQGFLNHCRIAHKVDYKSHDAAAVDCGRLLDEQEAANLPTEANNTPAPPKPTVHRAAPSQPTHLRTWVHPLNSLSSAPNTAGPPQSAKVKRIPITSLSSTATSATNSPLTPSPQIPRLSAHLAKHQLGGDLSKAFANVKQKIDLGSEDDLLSPDIEQNSPIGPVVGSRTVTGGVRSGMPATGNVNRPPGRKGFRPPQQRPRAFPLALAPSTKAHADMPESPQDHASNLSPHTADSNPGLVSDHEDDDHSASEEEAPQDDIRRPLPPVGTQDCSENVEMDVAVDDDIDRHGVIIRRNIMFPDDERTIRTGGSPSKFGGNRS